MNGFSIKSVSDEGTYFLVKNWEQNKTFWKELKNVKRNDLYSGAGLATRSFRQLLKVMWEYKDDDLEIVKFEDGKMTSIGKVDGKAMFEQIYKEMNND